MLTESMFLWQTCQMTKKQPLKRRKKYLVFMTSMYGTYTAGTYITETARQAKAKAKKQNGPEWTYYIA